LAAEVDVVGDRAPVGTEPAHVEAEVVDADVDLRGFGEGGAADVECGLGGMDGDRVALDRAVALDREESLGAAVVVKRDRRQALALVADDCRDVGATGERRSGDVAVREIPPMRRKPK
jgi:hypothetical protein